MDVSPSNFNVHNQRYDPDVNDDVPEVDHPQSLINKTMTRSQTALQHQEQPQQNL
jgi:hypothetical protein